MLPGEEISNPDIQEDDGFISKVVKKCQQRYETSWRMTNKAYPMLALASNGNPGVAKYILDKIDPEPEEVISTVDIVEVAPMKIEEPKGVEYGCPEDKVFKK